jgi:hypothetical protein
MYFHRLDGTLKPSLQAAFERFFTDILAYPGSNLGVVAANTGTRTIAHWRGAQAQGVSRDTPTDVVNRD